MKRKITILLGVLLVLAIFSGTIVANSQDHNHNTNGEDDGNYSDNNDNPYDDGEFPGNEQQQRSGVEW